MGNDRKKRMRISHVMAKLTIGCNPIGPVRVGFKPNAVVPVDQDDFWDHPRPQICTNTKQ